MSVNWNTIIIFANPEVMKASACVRNKMYGMNAKVNPILWRLSRPLIYPQRIGAPVCSNSIHSTNGGANKSVYLS